MRGADTFSRDHSEMALTRVSGGRIEHTSTGWNTKVNIFNEEGRTASPASQPMMAGTKASDIEMAALGRTSGRPGSATFTDIYESIIGPFPASGSPSFGVGSGHLANPVDHPEAFNRWFVSTNNLNPGAVMLVKATIPPGVESDGCFMQIYHPGPAGCNEGNIGSGRFVTMLMLDGSAILKELNAAGTEWFEHARFKLVDGPIGTGKFTLLISSLVVYTEGGRIGNVIEYTGLSGGSKIFDTLYAGKASLANTVHAQNRANPLGNSIVISVNDGSSDEMEFVESKAMIEVRRDIGANVHLSNIEQEAGVFDDREVHIRNGDIDATADYPLTIYAAGLS